MSDDIDLIAALDQRAAEMVAVANLLCVYRRALMDGGFGQDMAEGLAAQYADVFVAMAFAEDADE